MKFHYERKNNILSYFETDATKGLSTEKAKQMLEKHGLNQLKEKKKKSMFARFVEQFKDAMILILLAASKPAS